MSYYTEFVREFAERSRSNLERIEAKKHRGEKYYEVTQLINSLLGMLVFIHEDEILSNKRLVCIPGFPDVKPIVGKRKTRLSDLVEALRNAVCHGQIKQAATGDSKTITGFTFWTTPSRGEKPRRRTWEAKYSLAEIRFIAIYLTKLIPELPSQK